MKKADILRMMAAVIYAGNIGEMIPDDYEDNIEFACDNAERIYDRLNCYDPNTKEYIEDSDPAYEKKRKSLAKLKESLKNLKKGQEIDDMDPDDLPF